MKTLPIKVFEVLEKSKDSQEYKDLLSDLEAPSSVLDMTPRTVHLIQFDRAGISLLFSTETEKFYSATFSFKQTQSADTVGAFIFTDLPLGVSVTDDCNQLDCKLGVKANKEGWVEGPKIGSRNGSSVSKQSYWKHYDIPPYYLVVIFENDKGCMRSFEVRVRR